MSTFDRLKLSKGMIRKQYQTCTIVIGAKHFTIFSL